MSDQEKKPEIFVDRPDLRQRFTGDHFIFQGQKYLIRSNAIRYGRLDAEPVAPFTRHQQGELVRFRYMRLK